MYRFSAEPLHQTPLPTFFAELRTQQPGDVAGVNALALDDDRLYVARIGRHVEEFDATSMDFRREIRIPRLGVAVAGLVATQHPHRLYVSDAYERRVHCVDLDTGLFVESFKVKSNPRGLAINADRNILVACSRDARAIEIRAPDGTLQCDERKIFEGISYPWHCIQLNRMNVVLSLNSPDIQSYGVVFISELTRQVGVTNVDLILSNTNDY